MSYDIYCTVHGNQRTENWHERCPQCVPLDSTEVPPEFTDELPPEPAFDPVIKPAHYNQSTEIECIDAMRAVYGDEHFVHHCVMTAFKYVWRAFHKGDMQQNVEKAIWYLRMSIGDDPRNYR